VLVRAGLVVAVHPATDAAEVGRLWDAVRTGTSLAGILDLLTAAGVASAPDFVLVETDAAATRALVRGPAVVRFGNAGEPLSGEGATTWNERRIVDRSFEIVLEPSTEAELPLVTGIVRAASMSVGGSPEPAATPASLGMTVPARDDPTDADESAVGEPVAEDDDDPFDSFFRAEVAKVRETTAPPVEPSRDLDLEVTVRVSRAELAAARAARLAQRRALGGARFWLDLPDGTRAPIDPEVLIGRSPTVARAPGDRIPRIVTLDHRQISRDHAMLVAERDGVVVVDLGSTNGITLRHPGGTARRLMAGERELVGIGTVIDLGNGDELTVRGEA